MAKADRTAPRGFVEGDMNAVRPLFRAAIEEYNAALKVAPNLWSAYVGRGRARHALGDDAGALADYAAALTELKGDWRSYEPLCERSALRWSQGDWEGAIADLQEAVAIVRSAPDGRIPERVSSELEFWKKQRDSRR